MQAAKPTTFHVLNPPYGGHPLRQIARLTTRPGHTNTILSGARKC